MHRETEHMQLVPSQATLNQGEKKTEHLLPRIRDAETIGGM